MTENMICLSYGKPIELNLYKTLVLAIETLIRYNEFQLI